MLGGSDAGAHLDLMCHANYPTVVLGEVVRDRGLLSVEEAVAMMTDRPARHYGLTDRGRIAEGCHADLVVFDPDTVDSEPAALVARPARRRRAARRPASTGVAHVLVAGVEVVARRAGSPTHRPGTGPAVGPGHRDGDRWPTCRRRQRQAVAAPSITRVVPLTVAASSEAR